MPLSEFSYGSGTQTAYKHSLHSLPMGEDYGKKSVRTFFDLRHTGVPENVRLKCPPLLLFSLQRISKNRVFSFLVGLIMTFFIMASYMLVSDKKGLLFILSHYQMRSVNVGTGNGSTEAFAESTVLDMKGLVELINSKQEYPPRKVPEEEDVIETDPHLFSVIPRHFLPGIKSPCWYEEYPAEPNSDPYGSNPFFIRLRNFKNLRERLKTNFRQHLLHRDGKRLRLRCLPYFYIIGQPKCGTTDLFHRLLLHPDIRYNGIKEPHWWTRKRFGYKHNKDGSEEKYRVEDYLDLFDLTAQKIQEGLSGNSSGDRRELQSITGDGSASTMWDNQFWSIVDRDRQEAEPRFLVQDFIHTLDPTARIIVILRDPAERLYSDYLYFRSTNKSAKAFHQSVVKSVQLFQSCLSEKSLRSCAYDGSLYLAMPVRLHLGLYVVFLLDWLTVFHREQILVLQLEDYAANVKVTIKKVFDFLNLGPFPEQVETALTQLPTCNTRRTADKNLGPMLPATKDLLREFYQPFNQKLAGVLNDNAFLWSHT
uniref:Sulfotransferase n=1 Tax=Salarias fasciatus TaxID=181472 RepID=A0A672GJ97_SALFA